jgi:hypothetical protein
VVTYPLGLVTVTVIAVAGTAVVTVLSEADVDVVAAVVETVVTGDPPTSVVVVVTVIDPGEAGTVPAVIWVRTTVVRPRDRQFASLFKTTEWNVPDTALALTVAGFTEVTAQVEPVDVTAAATVVPVGIALNGVGAPELSWISKVNPEAVRNVASAITACEVAQVMVSCLRTLMLGLHVPSHVETIDG